jgi:hypothetical protein
MSGPLSYQERQLLANYQAADARGRAGILACAQFAAQDVQGIAGTAPPPAEPARVIPFKTATQGENTC